jgi:hypothetical protein
MTARTSPILAVVGAVVLAACGPSHVRPIPPPTAPTRSAHPLRIFVAPVADERAVLPHHERWRATACAIVRRKPPALRLGADARTFFADRLVAALQARGHTIVADSASSEVTIEPVLKECTVDLQRGFFAADSVVRIVMRLAVRRSADRTLVTEREQVEEWRRQVMSITRGNQLVTLETGIARFSQDLANDDGLERALQRAGRAV